LFCLILAATLSPVPEAEDYEPSELSLSDVIIRSTGPPSGQSNKRKAPQVFNKLVCSIE